MREPAYLLSVEPQLTARSRPIAILCSLHHANGAFLDGNSKPVTRHRFFPLGRLRPSIHVLRAQQACGFSTRHGNRDRYLRDLDRLLSAHRLIPSIR